MRSMNAPRTDQRFQFQLLLYIHDKLRINIIAQIQKKYA